MCRARASHISSESKASPLASLQRLPNVVFVRLIRLYQIALSPYLPPSCRFSPTCSSYSLQAFRKYGFFKAFWLSFMRIIRCNPFCKGGYDPLP